jgi:receptor protein-tyrosine kinase
MSIVERALQKAQAQNKATAAQQPEQKHAHSHPITSDPVTRGLTRLDSVAPDSMKSGPVQPKIAATRRRGAPADDAESATLRDLKPVLHIDFARLRELGRLPSDDQAHQIEDEIRRIKWPLLNAIAGRDKDAAVRNNVILVTSALPGEGKTFTSLNLALSIVRDRELRVILVDGDVARPGLTPALGLEASRGINNVLEDTDGDIESVTYQTDVEGLFFVPAGKWHEHAPEFFAGSRMPQIIDDLARRLGNGVIIIDSPPLLATNEAQVVTRYVGQLLLVVHADETERQAVLDAIALVDKNTPISAVLNQVRPSILSRYYGQYYYGNSYRYEGARSRETRGGAEGGG